MPAADRARRQDSSLTAAAVAGSGGESGRAWDRRGRASSPRGQTHPRRSKFFSDGGRRTLGLGRPAPEEGDLGMRAPAFDAARECRHAGELAQTDSDRWQQQGPAGCIASMVSFKMARAMGLAELKAGGVSPPERTAAQRRRGEASRQEELERWGGAGGQGVEQSRIDGAMPGEAQDLPGVGLGGKPAG